MIRINTKPRHKNAGRPAHKRAPGYLQWLRGRKCLVDEECNDRIEAAHVDYGGDKGMGTKPSDKWAVPLCAHHHRQQHTIGIRSFEAMHKLDLIEAAKSYWQAWPGRIAWERKQDG